MSRLRIQGNLTESQTSAQLAARLLNGDLAHKTFAIIRPSPKRDSGPLDAAGRTAVVLLEDTALGVVAPKGAVGTQVDLTLDVSGDPSDA